MVLYIQCPHAIKPTIVNTAMHDHLNGANASPTGNPTTRHLAPLKDWNPRQLRQLLERRLHLRESGTGPGRSPGIHREHDIFESKLQSHVFQHLPIRVIKLPEMELMERDAVLSYLIKTHVQRRGQRSKEMDDKQILEWIQSLVRFAIFSHTWWQKEEPTYKSFYEQRDRRRSGKPTLRGYEKLQRFCDIAHREYGVEFAWADTVCIDKSSSTELDESIRSTFAWYRNSDVCIAYLGETNDLLDCASDRWFTRGWTLQEILAPHLLKFYTKDWFQLTDFHNDKLEDLDDAFPNPHQFHLLHDAILLATGLDMSTICHFKPGIRDPSLPKRMTWIARRVTTKAEDKAYCMMGIFGVSISTAYGEGAERAFFRLFSAILDVGYSRDWFMWGGKAIPHEVHPSRMIPSSPECYLSRDDIGEDELPSMCVREIEPLSLTNVGLPMKMLIVPACISFDPDRHAFYQLADIRISCPLSDEPVVVQGIASEWDDRSARMLAPQFALGVLNIVDRETMHAHKRLYAILLRRSVWEFPWTNVMPGWRHSKWEKWETNKALVFRCGKRFQRMSANFWDGLSISRSEVGWPEGGEDPKISLQTVYL